MHTVTLVSSNTYKLQSANLICEPLGVTFEPVSLHIPEIQAADGSEIVKDKAQKAFNELRKPILVNDDTWSFPGLGGFPGPYMADINKWLSVDDFGRLFAGLQDRRVFLIQHAVYQDQTGQHIFRTQIEGLILEKPQGASKYTHSAYVSFDGGEMSSAEYGEAGKSSLVNHRTVWHDFAEWYTKNHVH